MLAEIDTQVHPPILDRSAIAYQLPQDNRSLFVGRVDLLRDLASRLESAESQVALTACKGLGGVGKSWIAVHYLHGAAYRHKIWFNAESLESLRSQYIDLGLQLRLWVPEDVKSMPGEEVVRQAKMYLESLAEPLLIVYDNATNYADLAGFIPSKGKMLITTRESGWPATAKLEVDIMSEPDAIALVLKMLGDRDPGEVKQLIDTLGKLPLAMTQACAYIQQAEILIREYLSLYEGVKQRMLADGKLSPGHTHENVWVTFTLSASKIKSINPHALKLLDYAGFLAPEPIPRTLLKEALIHKDELSAEDHHFFDAAISVLGSYSLFKFDVVAQTVVMHRVLREVIQQNIIDQDRTYQRSQSEPTFIWSLGVGPEMDAVLRVLEEKVRLIAMGEDEDTQRQILSILLPSAANDFLRAKVIERDNFQHLKQLLPHLKALTLQCKASGLRAYVDIMRGDSQTRARKKRMGNHYAHLLEDFADCASSCGEVKVQIPLLEEAGEILMLYGDSSEFFNCRNKLGRAYQESGRAEESRDLLESLLKSQEKFGKKGSLEYAKVLGNLGAAYYYLTDYPKAKERYEEALAIERRLLPGRSIEVMQTLGSLALVERDLGNPCISLGYLTEVLPVVIQCYGDKHVEAARAFANMAATYSFLGELDAARDLLERALIIQKSHYGEDHPEVARNKVNLAIVYAAQNGEAHSEVIKARMHLADVDSHLLATPLLRQAQQEQNNAGSTQVAP